MKKQKHIILLLIIFLAMAIAGCGNKVVLDSMKTASYTNSKAGYTVMVPKTWVKQSEDQVSTVFVNREPTVVFDLVCEIGGYDYYSMEGLAQETAESLEEKINDLEIIEKSSDENTTIYRFIMEGKLNDGGGVKIYSVIMEPEIGIRYFLLFAAAPGDFEKYQGLFEDVSGTFKQVKSKNELYQQFL